MSSVDRKASSVIDLEIRTDVNAPGRNGSVGSAPKLNDESQDGEWTVEEKEKPKPPEKPKAI